jgi:hypothetical protein
MASLTGTIKQLTITGNQCIVLMKDASGHDLDPVTLMASRDNYNAMVSTVLLAASNKCQTDLFTDASGITGLSIKL